MLLIKKRVLLFALVALVLLAAGSAAVGITRWLMLPHSPVASGIEGTVTYGPVCPVEPCSVKPTFNFDIIALQNGAEMGRTRPDATGKYRISLKPGIYQVKADRTFASNFDGPSPEAKVEGGRFTQLDLSFDTGIR